MIAVFCDYKLVLAVAVIVPSHPSEVSK